MHFALSEMARSYTTAPKSSSPSIFTFISIFIIIVITWPQTGFTQAEITSSHGFLPQAERDALEAIAEELGKTDWYIARNPCDNDPYSTQRSISFPPYNNTVNCNCSFPGGECHVEDIFFMGQDLQGVLPPSLAKLPFLKKIDFSRNYLSGTIPPEWATMNLKYISVMVNRLSGPIPPYLGNIKTLVHLSLESNMFNGTVPAELGKLENLENLILKDNKLNGHLPDELRNLTKLQNLRLSSNNFTGVLPNFERWQSLKYLEIEASGLQGPIPPSISFLKNVTELRISNINGGPFKLPPLGELKSMRALVLRSCNIVGPIPGEIANMGNLWILDLSFNKLDGNIPNFDALSSLETVFLTGNLLTGPIPDWILNGDTKRQIDVSYNNFSWDSEPATCPETLNLYRSSDEGKHLDQAKCLQRFPCSRENDFLHINCGGNTVTSGDRKFEADLGTGGPVKFNLSNSRWGTSSTGNFWGANSSLYTASNVSVIRANDSELYTTARLSPLSLTYYGRCLANGNYTVTLYFAEIVFRDYRSYLSLGRRMFDVYVQNERKLMDFDIKREANGSDKAVSKQFKGVQVKNGVLELRFAYAGKGSTAVPRRGVYGPLISAISMESEFPRPSHGKTKLYIELGAASAALPIILTILGAFWRRWYTKNRISREKEQRGLMPSRQDEKRKGYQLKRKRSKEFEGLEQQMVSFTLKQLKRATSNFDAKNKIGEGGFGPVYKGVLHDGTPIAVKQLSSTSVQGNREFLNEIGMISCLEHPNLVKLHGCCIHGNQLMLVYEYLENNCLARSLFVAKDSSQIVLDWPTRFKISIGIARGLSFLHEGPVLNIVHRDIKATNVLLGDDLSPKISDFGLAKLGEDGRSHISTRVAGTIGYMAPEYALRGYLTFKADVYSYGMVALEIVSGKNNHAYTPDSYIGLLDWACSMQRSKNFEELLDKRLTTDVNREEVERLVKVALLCTNGSPSVRPTMAEVVRMLEGHMAIPDVIPEAFPYAEAMRGSLRELQNESLTGSLTQRLATTETVPDSCYTSNNDDDDGDDDDDGGDDDDDGDDGDVEVILWSAEN